MTEEGLRLMEEMLRLSAEDRLELAHILWESVDPPPGEAYESEEEFIAELDRRAAEYRAGPSTGQPFREAIEELRQEALRNRGLQ